MRGIILFQSAMAAGLIALFAVAATAQPEKPELPEGVEILARGPVHEAFARPTNLRPEESPLVRQEPPRPVDEVPPEERPEGDDVQWMPGYWDWDDEEEGYVWICGFWRETPPGQRWTPGFWQRVEGGWQWSPGFWMAEDADEVEYVPLPPESLERGPSTPAPDEDSVYVSGCWVFQETRFQWRPGFWVRSRPDWVYVPAHYIWTPAGCVFIEGRWDHPLHDRGLLFAPVRIAPTVIVQREWSYVPRYVVAPDALFGCLFVRVQSGRYHFGDYFADRYTKQFVPWVNYGPARNIPDANYAYYHRQGPERWGETIRSFYTARYRGQVALPPHTLAQQTRVVQNLTTRNQQDVMINQTFNITQGQNVRILQPLRQVNNAPVSVLGALSRPAPGAGRPEVRKVMKLEPVAREQQRAFQDSAARAREAAQQRQQQETRLRAEAARRGQEGRPAAVRAPLPKPPTPTTPVRPEARPAPRKERPPAPKPPRPEQKVTPSPTPPSAAPPRTPDRPRDNRPPEVKPQPSTPRPPTPQPDRPRDQQPQAPRPRQPAPKQPAPMPMPPSAPQQPQPRPQQPRPQQPRPEQPQQGQPRPAPQQQAPRPAQPRPQQAQPRPAQPRPAQPQPAQPRPAQPRPQQVQPRPAQPRPAQPQQGQPKPAPGKPKQDRPKK